MAIRKAVAAAHVVVQRLFRALNTSLWVLAGYHCTRLVDKSLHNGVSTSGFTTLDIGSFAEWSNFPLVAVGAIALSCKCSTYHSPFKLSWREKRCSNGKYEWIVCSKGILKDGEAAGIGRVDSSPSATY